MCTLMPPASPPNRSARLPFRRSRLGALAYRVTAAALLTLLATACIKRGSSGYDSDHVDLGTAWVEPNGARRLDVNVGNTDLTSLGVGVVGTFGLPYGTQVSANAAHLALGIPNLAGRWNFFHHPKVSLAVDARLMVVRPAWVYALDLVDPTLRPLLSDLTLAILPLKFFATFQPHDRITLGLVLGYDHVAASGEVEIDAIVAAGAVGARRGWVRPVAHLYLGDRVALIVAATLPFYASALASGGGEVAVQPGIVAGGRTVTWQRLPAWQTFSTLAAIEVRLGRTHLRAGVSSFALIRELGVPVIPTLGGVWRL